MRLAGLVLLLSASVSHAYFGVAGAVFTRDSSSSATTRSSNDSTASTGQSTANSSSTGESTGVAAPTMSTIVLASALLLGTAGGIITTFYSNAVAQKRAEEFRRLHPPPAEPRPAAPETPSLPLPPSEPAAPPISPWVPPIDAMVMARSWLLANELQLKQDLAIGAGPAIDDLAGIAAIAPSNRGHFGKLLQRNRSVLLAPREVTPRQAAEMMARVGDLVMADPVLRADGELALAR